jgi:hypothetical protein
LSALEARGIVKKYSMKYGVNNMMAALSRTEKVVSGVQQKANKQHLTLIDMRKK